MDSKLATYVEHAQAAARPTGPMSPSRGSTARGAAGGITSGDGLNASPHVDGQHNETESMAGSSSGMPAALASTQPRSLLEKHPYPHEEQPLGVQLPGARASGEQPVREHPPGDDDHTAGSGQSRVGWRAKWGALKASQDSSTSDRVPRLNLQQLGDDHLYLNGTPAEVPGPATTSDRRAEPNTGRPRTPPRWMVRPTSETESALRRSRPSTAASGSQTARDTGGWREEYERKQDPSRDGPSTAHPGSNLLGELEWPLVVQSSARPAAAVDLRGPSTTPRFDPTGASASSNAFIRAHDEGFHELKRPMTARSTTSQQSHFSAGPDIDRLSVEDAESRWATRPGTAGSLMSRFSSIGSGYEHSNSRPSTAATTASRSKYPVYLPEALRTPAELLPPPRDSADDWERRAEVLLDDYPVMTYQDLRLEDRNPAQARIALGGRREGIIRLEDRVASLPGHHPSRCMFGSSVRYDLRP